MFCSLFTFTLFTSFASAAFLNLCWWSQLLGGIKNLFPVIYRNKLTLIKYVMIVLFGAYYYFTI